MDTLRQRTVYPTAKQKRKLISSIAQNPKLVSVKGSQDLKYRDSVRTLWVKIASECNSLPGARKTWKQWRKTWQDIKSNVKKKQSVKNGEVPASITKLTDSEREALGFKSVSSTTNYQDTMEFVAPEDESTHDDTFNGFNDVSYSEPTSPPEVKVNLNRSQLKAKKVRSHRSSQSHSDNCAFNCDRMAIQEERKIQIKEDYFNFKKDYLKQKLLLMKEQTEALKGIAKELAK